MWVLWFVSFLSILIGGIHYALEVFFPTNSFSHDSALSGAYLFAGLVGLMAYGNLKEISQKVAALEAQARTAPHASS